MASDAHAHPGDLLDRFPGAEEERRRLRVPCAASAWNLRDFGRHEELARKAREEGAAPLALCFAVHPQLPAALSGPEGSAACPEDLRLHAAALEKLAAEGRIRAVGETGFDLFNRTYRDTEALQEELFRAHLEAAERYGLPMVLHIRRAMHKVFAHAKALKKLPAVVFHSYSGTFAEGEALLKRGLNAWFSFGAAILLNHKTAMEACARLPPDRLLLETDAPYQPLRGVPFSRWADLPAIFAGAAGLRGEAEEELEAAVDGNWTQVFGASGGLP
ncbi:MAG: TatD family hydrolase [Treponema sp.]|jgi:TatD DNase family protein|nr:TatD family hydrolase [Treponema sp.]